MSKNEYISYIHSKYSLPFSVCRKVFKACHYLQFLTDITLMTYRNNANSLRDDENKYYYLTPRGCSRMVEPILFTFLLKGG